MKGCGSQPKKFDKVKARTFGPRYMGTEIVVVWREGPLWFAPCPLAIRGCCHGLSFS